MVDSEPSDFSNSRNVNFYTVPVIATLPLRRQMAWKRPSQKTHSKDLSFLVFSLAVAFSAFLLATGTIASEGSCSSICGECLPPCYPLKLYNYENMEEIRFQTLQQPPPKIDGRSHFGEEFSTSLEAGKLLYTSETEQSRGLKFQRKTAYICPTKNWPE